MNMSVKERWGALPLRKEHESVGVIAIDVKPATITVTMHCQGQYHSLIHSVSESVSQ
jgi:hypothetical protein